MLGMLQTVVQPESVIHAIGPRLWYDARYISDTFVTGNQILVNSVPNRSGLGNPMKMEDVSKKPAVAFNNLVNSPCIRFDGVNDYLTSSEVNMTTVQAVTIFSKYNVVNNSFYETLFSRGVDWTATDGGLQVYIRNSPPAPFGSDIYLGARGIGTTLSVSRATGPYGYNQINTVTFKQDFTQQGSAFSQQRIYVSGTTPGGSGYTTASAAILASSATFGNSINSLGTRVNAQTQILGGDIYQFILITRTLTDDQIYYVERNVLPGMW